MSKDFQVVGSTISLVFGAIFIIIMRDHGGSFILPMKVLITIIVIMLWGIISIEYFKFMLQPTFTERYEKKFKVTHVDITWLFTILTFLLYSAFIYTFDIMVLWIKLKGD